jgi:hypothetical protein
VIHLCRDSRPRPNAEKQKYAEDFRRRFEIEQSASAAPINPSHREEIPMVQVMFDAGQSAGGQKPIGGETVIGWEPSATEVAVKITVMFQGTIVGSKTLVPTDLTLTYDGLSGEDFTKGTIKAKFAGTGKGGQIDSQGDLTWQVTGAKGSYRGFIGEWSVS